MEDDPPRFRQGSTCPAVLGCVPKRHMNFAYRTVTSYGRPFQTVPLSMCFVTLRTFCRTSTEHPSTPDIQRLQSYIYPVWASPVSLAATSGISFDFFSCGYLDVSVLRVRSIPPIYSADGSWLDTKSVARFGNLRVVRLLAANRSLSQLPTSFFASWYPGIHRTPLVA